MSRRNELGDQVLVLSALQRSEGSWTAEEIAHDMAPNAIPISRIRRALRLLARGLLVKRPWSKFPKRYAASPFVKAST